MNFWRNTMVHQQLHKSVYDLGVNKIVTVHNSKYALSKHPWDEPLDTEKELRDNYGLDVIILIIVRPLFFE